MKPHKHAELIKAWADGTIIQYKDFNDDWADCVCNLPVWNLNTEYRIKPEPKPDIVKYLAISADIETTIYTITTKQESAISYDNCVKLIFDGDNPSILKSLEVIK